MTSEKEKPANANKKKIVIPIVIGGVVVLAAAGAALGYIGYLRTIPAKNYEEAVQAFDAGEFEVAASKFEAAGDYKDAKEKVGEIASMAHYKAGKEALASGDLDKAKEELTAAGDYKDAKLLASDCESAAHYEKAMALSNAGDYLGAVNELKKAINFSDAKEKIYSICITQGTTAKSNGDLEKAYEYYKLAGDVADIQDVLGPLAYDLGVKAQNNSEFEKAIEYFTVAGSYKDTESLMKACYLKLAAAADSKNDTELADKYYALAGENRSEDKKPEYKKPEEKKPEDKKPEAKTENNYYLSAEAEYAAGRLKEAADLYVKAGKYKDAAEKAKKIYYDLAAEAEKKNDKETAILYYAKAGDYKDAAKKIGEDPYKLGVKLQKEGKYDEASDMFKLAGNYKDSKTRILNMAFEIANKGSDEWYNIFYAYENSDFDTWFTYLRGVFCMRIGDYDSAVNDFTTVGKFRNAQTLITECSYLRGCDKLAVGKFEEARQIFALLGNYKYSKALINVCYGEIFFADNKIDAAYKKYKAVSNKVKVNGFDVQARKRIINTEMAFYRAEGDYIAKSNNTYVKHVTRSGRRIRWRKWYLTFVPDDQELYVSYERNADGTYRLYIKGGFTYFLNYSKSKENVEYDLYEFEKEFKNLKKFPKKIKINRYITLTFVKGKYKLVYSKNKKSGRSVNQFRSKVTYKYDG